MFQAKSLIAPLLTVTNLPITTPSQAPMYACGMNSFPSTSLLRNGRIFTSNLTHSVTCLSTGVSGSTRYLETRENVIHGNQNLPICYFNIINGAIETSDWVREFGFGVNVVLVNVINDFRPSLPNFLLSLRCAKLQLAFEANGFSSLQLNFCFKCLEDFRSARPLSFALSQ